MKHKITSEITADQLISVQNGSKEFSCFVETMLHQPDIVRELDTCLKIINSTHGASPDIKNLIFTNVKANADFLSGTLSTIYELNLYWGCSASSAVNRVETVWSFAVSKETSTIEFVSNDDNERSTSDEF